MWWLFGEMWWLIIGDVVAHYWRCGGSLLQMWWLIIGEVVAHYWRCGGSLLEMLWLIVADVVAHYWRCGGSLLQMWWLIGSSPDFWGRGLGFESGISTPDVLQVHCVKM